MISRASFDGRLTTQNIVGASFRYVHAIGKESFNSGVIALDRRDISQGPAANDIIDSPFNIDPPGAIGLGWENDVRSNTSDAGLFAVSDLAWDKRLDLTLGGRYDNYNVRSVDMGVLAFEPASGQGGKGAFTYSASLTYKTDWGLVPYLTNAKSAAIEIGQASQVLTSLLAAKDWLSASFLNEAGVKFAFLDDHLTGALSWYRQERTQLQQGAGHPRDGHALQRRGAGDPLCGDRKYQLHLRRQPAAHHGQGARPQLCLSAGPHRRGFAAERFRRLLCHLRFLHHPSRQL